jgi:hypothetical protein
MKHHDLQKNKKNDEKITVLADGYSRNSHCSSMLRIIILSYLKYFSLYFLGKTCCRQEKKQNAIPSPKIVVLFLKDLQRSSALL